MPDIVKLTAEDKRKFADEAKKLTAHEFVQVAKELEVCKNRFSSADWAFMCSHLGRRAEKLLRNVVKNQSFDD